MVRDAAPAGLSRASRRLTAVVAGWSGMLGLLLFLAPGWAAPRFAWNVSALVVMTVGGWLLGNCYWATRVVLEWSWARWSSGLGYLWGFAVLQTVVLVVYADKVRPESPVAWLYLGLIGLTDVAAVVGVVDVLRLRPLADEPGPPVPGWLRALVVGFVGFVTFLFAVAMVRPSAAVGGGVFPEDMSAFTLRSFGAYFLALVLGALVVARRRTLGPLISHIEGGLAITVPILVAAVVHLEVFDVGAHPLQWLYLGAYVATVAIGLPTVLRYRRVAGPARVLAPSPPAGSPAPGAPAR